VKSNNAPLSATLSIGGRGRLPKTPAWVVEERDEYDEHGVIV
jgi:hypothetical protein